MLNEQCGRRIQHSPCTILHSRPLIIPRSPFIVCRRSCTVIATMSFNTPAAVHHQPARRTPLAARRPGGRKGGWQNQESRHSHSGRGYRSWLRPRSSAANETIWLLGSGHVPEGQAERAGRRRRATGAAAGYRLEFALPDGGGWAIPSGNPSVQRQALMACPP